MPRRKEMLIVYKERHNPPETFNLYINKGLLWTKEMTEDCHHSEDVKRFLQWVGCGAFYGQIKAVLGAEGRHGAVEIAAGITAKWLNEVSSTSMREGIEAAGVIPCRLQRLTLFNTTDYFHGK